MDTVSKKAQKDLYIITDNMVASSISLVAKLTGKKLYNRYQADGSTHVDEGILMSQGISFYEIGRQTAIMAKKILVDKIPTSEIPVESSPNLEVIVNSKVMESLGLAKDNKAFEGAKFVE